MHRGYLGAVEVASNRAGMSEMLSPNSSEWKLSDRIASLDPQRVDCRGEFQVCMHRDTADLTPFSFPRSACTAIPQT